MMLSRVAALALAGLSCCAPALAQDTATGALTLDDCLRLALAEHPVLKASAHRHEAAVARVKQAQARPQPTFDFDSDLQPQPFNFAGSGESYIGLTQTIEFPGRRSLRTSVAQREADGLAADVDLLRITCGSG